MASFLSWQRSHINSVLLGLLFFVASFVYNLLCPLKKTVILYIPGASVESFVYLKFFFIAPGSVFLTSLFLFLCARISRKYIFRTFISLFGTYFVLYAFVFHPYQDAWRFLFSSLFLGFLSDPTACTPLVEYWMEALFATAAELWGTTIVSLLIWGFVNQSMTQQQAQEKYVYLTLGVNGSAIASGWVSLLIQRAYIEWTECFFVLQMFLIASVVVTWLLYEFLESRGVFDSPLVADRAQKAYAKYPLTLVQSFWALWKNPSLWYIAVLVISYNTVYIFSDLLFMQEIKTHFSVSGQASSNQLLTYISMMTGVFAGFFALCVYPLIQQRSKWLQSALITPFIYTLSAASFFIALYFPQEFSLYAAYPASILLGGLHLALLRGARYSVFDATKEMAYLGMKKDDQIQGKSIIDTIISRIGKSLGSFIVFMILLLTRMTKLEDISPLLILTALCLAFYWIKAIFALDQLQAKRIDVSQEGPLQPLPS